MAQEKPHYSAVFSVADDEERFENLRRLRDAYRMYGTRLDVGMERDDDFGIRRDSDGWADFDRGFPNIPIADYRGAVVLREEGEPQGEPQGLDPEVIRPIGDDLRLHDVPNRAERAETPVVPVVEEVHLEPQRTRVDRFPDTAAGLDVDVQVAPANAAHPAIDAQNPSDETFQNGG